MKFEIENLSKGQADCFFVTIENDIGDECTILIDGNREGRNSESCNIIIERISKLEKLDYIFVTHIDNDHLGGILNLFEYDEKEGPNIDQQLMGTIIVYNNVTQGLISYKQAQRFEYLIRDKKVINSYSNKYDNYNSMLKILSLKKRRILKLNISNENNAYITFLNPDKKGVYEVNSDYLRCINTGKKGRSELINKNSIAFLLEFKGKKVLFSGDAFLEDIIESVNKITDLKEINLIKIPHHGTEKYNLELDEFAERYECKKFILTGKLNWNGEHPSDSIINKLYDKLSGDLDIHTEIDLSRMNCKYTDIYNAVKKINVL